jgi:hypothetical protein
MNKEYKSLGQNFVIHYEETINGFEGKCYSTINWENSNNEKGWNYCSGSEGGIGHEELNDDCRCLFGFSIVWRGCWDERIYFKDDEYWSEELQEMTNFWKEISLLLREQIRVILPGGIVDE